ncbi:MAG: S9 family peptidase, partial [Myxococcota bacterium]
VQREFDPVKKTFVVDGFVTPEAKQGAVWIDQDRVLIATDWGGDGSTLTESGYPSSVRLWRRGQPLDEAQELLSVDRTHIGAWPWMQELQDGGVIYGAVDSDTFYTGGRAWRVRWF